MQRTGPKNAVRSSGEVALIRDKLPGTAAKAVDFLFIGGGDTAADLDVWQRTCGDCDLVADNLLTDDCNGSNDAERLQSLLAKVLTMRQQGRVDRRTQIVILLHGKVVNGEFFLSALDNGQRKFQVKAELLLSGLREILSEDPRAAASILIHLACCHAGKLRLPLAKTKGHTFLYMGKKPGLTEMAIDTISQVIKAWSRELRGEQPPSRMQVEMLWSEAKAHAGENVAWIEYRKMHKHKAIDALSDKSSASGVDPSKRRRVVYAKLNHGSLTSLQAALGEHPRKAIKQRYLEGTPPLHIAAQSDRQAKLKLDYLVESLGEDVDEVDEDGQSSLHCAAEADGFDAALALVLQGANVLQADDDGFLPLHSAAQCRGHPKLLIEALLLGDPDQQVDRPGPSGRSALQMAVKAGGYEAVATLLMCGASPDFEDPEGLSAHDLAQTLPTGETRTSIEGLLQQFGLEINALDSDGSTRLHAQVARGNAQDLRMLLSSGASPYRRDKDGRFPLHRVASHSKRDTVKKLELLLKSGPGVNETDLVGNTPLHMAATVGNRQAVVALLALGADPNQPNKYGMLPIHMAAKDMVDLILPAMRSYQADPQRANARPPAPSLRLHRIAATSQDISEMRALLDLPGALVRCDAQGHTALAAAVLNGNDVAARYLLGENDSPDVRLSDGLSLLQHARAAHREDMVELLLEFDANPDW
jgi:ankyrin repeat protein